MLIFYNIFFISIFFILRFPTILNEMVVRSGEGFKTCEIIAGMDSTSDEVNSVCMGVIDMFMFQVLVMIGAAFTVFYLIFSFTIDIIGKKNLLGKIHKT